MKVRTVFARDGHVAGIARHRLAMVLLGAACACGACDSTSRPKTATSVSVSAPSDSLEEGSTLQLAASVRDATGQELSGRVVTWSSSDTAVLRVSATGLATGVAPGKAIASATADGRTGSMSISVKLKAVGSVTVSALADSVEEGFTLQLAAAIRDTAGRELLGRDVSWSSSDTLVLRLSGSGLASGVGPGSATATATSGGKSGSLTVRVMKARVIGSVAVTAPRKVLEERSATQFTVLVRDSSGQVLAGRPVTWASSDTLIAKVSNAGIVTAVSRGSVTITATSGGKSGQAGATVVVALEVGGSVYLVYSAEEYLLNPTLDAWDRSARTPVGAYHLDSAAVKQQLPAMYARGQRKLQLALWYANYGGIQGLKDTLNYAGNVMNSALGELFPQHRANLIRVLQLARDAGFREILLRYGQIDMSHPFNWKAWDEAMYSNGWSYISSIHDLAEQTLQGSGVRLMYDLGCEVAGVELGEARPFVRRLWHDWTTRYGTTRTVGISIATGPYSETTDRVARAIEDFDAGAGVRPPEYALDMYGDEGATLAYAVDGLRRNGEGAKSIMITEAYYNDAVTGAVILSARDSLALNLRTLFQWPTARGFVERGWLTTVNWPAEYGNYLSTLFRGH